MGDGPTEARDETVERVQAMRAETARRRRGAGLVAILGVALIALVAASFVLVRGGGGESGSSDPQAAGATKPKDTPTEAASRKSNATDGREGPNWKPFKGPVPILMYHPIQDPVPGNPYPDLFLTREDFADQVRWLAKSGYEAVTLNEVLASWFEGGTLPPKPIVLSFDDGYVSQYENAFPLMEERGWPGVLNLKARDSDIYDRQVREMVSAGWEIASHTVTHPDLPSTSETQLEDEMVSSRRILEREFDTPVTNFCYPAGRYDDRVIAAVKKAGYRSATSTESGLARPSDLWSLDRVRIELGDGSPELESKLTAAGA